MEFYLWIDDQQQGPYSEQDLRGQLAAGSIAEDTAAWKEGEADWSTIAALLPADSNEGSPVEPEIAPEPEPIPEIAASAKAPASGAPLIKRSTTAAGPKLSVGSATQPLKVGSVDEKQGSKTVSIQGTLKRGLAADLSRTGQDTSVVGTVSTGTGPQRSQNRPTAVATAPAAYQDNRPVGKAGLIGFILAFVFAPVGIFFSIKGMKQAGPMGLAIAGLVLNIIGVLAWITMVILMATVGLALFGIAKDQSPGNGLFTSDNQRIEQAVNEWSSSHGNVTPRNTDGREILRQLKLEGSYRYDREGTTTYTIRHIGPDKRWDSSDDKLFPKELPEPEEEEPAAENPTDEE